MKKKKWNPTHYFYHKLNLNYLMLKANSNIFKSLFLVKVHPGFNDKVFCFLQVHKETAIYFIKHSNIFINSTIILLYYGFFIMILCLKINGWLIDWLIDALVLLTSIPLETSILSKHIIYNIQTFI